MFPLNDCQCHIDICFCYRFRFGRHGGWNVGTICLLDKFSGTFRSINKWLCVIGNGVDSREKCFINGKWKQTTRASQCLQASLATSLEQKLFHSQKQLLYSACQRAHFCRTGWQEITKWVCQTDVVLMNMLPKEWHAQFDLVRSVKLRKSLDQSCTLTFTLHFFRCTCKTCST